MRRIRRRNNSVDPLTSSGSVSKCRREGRFTAGPEEVRIIRPAIYAQGRHFESIEIICFPDSEYDPESALKYKDYLSAFQIEKFTFMFNSLFDFDKVSSLPGKNVFLGGGQKIFKCAFLCRMVILKRRISTASLSACVSTRAGRRRPRNTNKLRTSTRFSLSASRIKSGRKKVSQLSLRIIKQVEIILVCCKCTYRAITFSFSVSNVTKNYTKFGKM